MAKSSTRAAAEARPGPSALPDARPDAPPSLGNGAKVVAWGMVFWGGVQLAGVALEKTAMATLLVQAVIAEWGAGRMGIPWTETSGHASTSLLRRITLGVALGGGVAAAAVVLSLVVGSATLWPAAPSAGALLIGLAASAFAAVRDELLLRGVVLRATRGLLPPWARILASGATAAAATFGASGGTPALLLGEALRGTALGGAWLRDRGAWMACAANTAWMWTFGAATRGNLWDVRFRAAPEASGPTLAMLGVAAAAAAWAVTRTTRRQPDAA